MFGDKPMPFVHTRYDEHRYLVMRQQNRRIYWAVFVADRATNRVFFDKPLGHGLARSVKAAHKWSRLCR